MTLEIRDFDKKDWPIGFHHIPDPPSSLRILGKPPISDNKYLCIVGSRKPTEYAKDVCEYLIEGLQGYPITIVSGLAFGIDTLAHKKAMEVGLQTISFPGSGLDENVLYPQTHINIARQIIESGGGLISEFDDGFKSMPWAFPKRNRLMAGISHTVLIIEASMISGTMITSRLATEYNKDVCTIPGSIFSNKNTGNKWLLKNGAIPITCVEDILETLDLTIKDRKFEINLNTDEKIVLDFITDSISKDDLMMKSKLEFSKLNYILSSLEIKGLIKETYGKIYRSTML